MEIDLYKIFFIPPASRVFIVTTESWYLLEQSSLHYQDRITSSLSCSKKCNGNCKIACTSMSSQGLTTITFYLQMVTILVPKADSCVKLASIAKKFSQWKIIENDSGVPGRIQQKCFLILCRKFKNNDGLQYFTFALHYDEHGASLESSSHRWWADSFICRPWTFSVSWDDSSFFQQKIFIWLLLKTTTRGN